MTRESYDPPDYICTIHYLCDVLDEGSPAFAVVPATHKKLTLKEAKETMPDYVETPLYGKAGTACFYDIACCASCIGTVVCLNDCDANRAPTSHDQWYWAAC